MAVWFQKLPEGPLLECWPKLASTLELLWSLPDPTPGYPDLSPQEVGVSKAPMWLRASKLGNHGWDFPGVSHLFFSATKMAMNAEEQGLLA